MFQPRGRTGSKLTVVHDAEGREIEVSTEIIELIVLIRIYL